MNEWMNKGYGKIKVTGAREQLFQGYRKKRMPYIKIMVLFFT